MQNVHFSVIQAGNCSNGGYWLPQRFARGLVSGPLVSYALIVITSLLSGAVPRWGWAEHAPPNRG